MIYPITFLFPISALSMLQSQNFLYKLVRSHIKHKTYKSKSLRALIFSFFFLSRSDMAAVWSVDLAQSEWIPNHYFFYSLPVFNYLQRSNLLCNQRSKIRRLLPAQDVYPYWKINPLFLLLQITNTFQERPSHIFRYTEFYSYVSFLLFDKYSFYL